MMSDKESRNPKHRLRDDILEALKLTEALMPPSIRGFYQVVVEALRDGWVTLSELEEEKNKGEK